ncbi:hypothetical protein [Ulvibacterium marinum]|nr:hypothetical protein [Ulvibacterium marinum]
MYSIRLPFVVSASLKMMSKYGILEGAGMTQNGLLTKHYTYLQDYVDGKE